jgi:hypothetical protein
MRKRPCHGGRTHQDALALVAYVRDRGGRTTAGNFELAEGLGWFHGYDGHQSLDLRRLLRARLHVRDREWPRSVPCTGARLRRAIGDDRALRLLGPDPVPFGDSRAAVETLLWQLAERKGWQTQVAGQIEINAALMSGALARDDKALYESLVRSQAELRAQLRP